MTAEAAEPSRRELPRRLARTRALELLFAADLRGIPLRDAAVDDPRHLDAFTARLLTTVGDHVDGLDEVIETHARGWTVERMPGVDRAILRLALAEMLHLDEVPAAVAIDEAVELAKTLSTDDSPRFVNGLLSAVATDRGLLA